jgi:hypothetical protein
MYVFIFVVIRHIRFRMINYMYLYVPESVKTWKYRSFQGLG